MMIRRGWFVARRRCGGRNVSSLVRVSSEVQGAVLAKQPVVALESTIITHGMPFPQNLEMALSVESIIRNQGAIPATISCLDGRFLVGMTSKEIETLAKVEKAAKISRRDLAVVSSRGMTGGTTIAGTMILAHMAGIKVFATGGLGGVHRRGEVTMDVSADLEELGRTPVAVISSGAKAILDIGRTMEYLETKGVTVTTIGEEGVEIPAFYSRESGMKSPLHSPTIEDAAKLICKPQLLSANVDANQLLNLQSGIAIFNPIPVEHSIPFAEIESVIEEAVEKCNQFGVIGKDITPFLLKRVVEATKGRSLEANLALVRNNVRVGADIAIKLASLEQSTPLQPPPIAEPLSYQSQDIDDSAALPVEIMVIGAMAVDLTCTLPNISIDTFQLHTSLPSKMHTSAGGVAYNVALAASYASSKPVRLVTALGSDPQGCWLREYASTTGLELDVLYVSREGETARYVAIHDQTGELITAAADMHIVEAMPVMEIKEAIWKGKPKFLAFDGNLSRSSIKSILEETAEMGTKVLFEPTSVPKAASIFSESIKLGLFPKHSISIVTPNIFELKALYEAAQGGGYFDTPEWWALLDSFNADSRFRQDVEILLLYLPELVSLGIVQQAMQLLPYIPNILIKLGSRGVLSVRLCPKDIKFDNESELLRLSGTHADVCIQHHKGLEHQGIVSVTGAGDTFSGVLLAQLASGNSIHKAVDIAQKAAIMTLASPHAVSPEIQELKLKQ